MKNYYENINSLCEQDPQLLLEVQEYEARAKEEVEFEVRQKVDLLSVTDEGVRCTGLPDLKQILRFCMRAKDHLSSQSYSLRLENWLGETFQMEKVPSTKGKADFFSDLIGHCESKASINKKGAFSVQQVRTGRVIPYYLLLLHSPRYLFLGFVPEAVIKKHLGSQSHGTAKSVKGNKDPERSLKTPRIKRDGSLNAVLADLEPYNYFGDGSHLVDNNIAVGTTKLPQGHHVN